MSSPDSPDDKTFVTAPSPYSDHSTPVEVHVDGPSEAPSTQVVEHPSTRREAEAINSKASTTQTERYVAQPAEAFKSQPYEDPARARALYHDSHVPPPRTEPLDFSIFAKVLEEDPDLQSKVRLGIAYPLDSGYDPSENPAAVRLSATHGGKMLFALIQSSRTPSFDFHLPYLHRALEENSSGTSSDKPNCQIVYNPTNDNCSLVHSAIGKQGTVISLGLTNTGTRCAGMLLDAEEPCIISPGIWTVSATIFESGRVKKVDLFDLLVLPRKFSVAIYAGSAASSKREAPAVIGRSAKRQRRRMESILPPSDKVVEVSLMQSASDANKRSPTPTPCDIIIGATISILDLKAGDTFFISTSVEGEEEAYQLQRTYDIMTTAAVSVFICQSPMRFEGEDVMAKVFRHNPDGSDLLEVANMWRQEKETLEQLVDHKNIVKLLGFDARQHVLYFKCLPASLGRGLISPFGPTHALTILRDISSALAHLADAKMLHNDIRPANIAYSRSQGAVLFNFAFASASGIESRYGTCWYLPPEFYDHKPRDSAADIWALGVTMLYALGKTQLPDYGVAWNHFEEQTATDGGDDKMEKWMDRVADCRSKLNKDDTVESLVFQMLDRDPAERTKAAAIELALKEAELT